MQEISPLRLVPPRQDRLTWAEFLDTTSLGPADRERAQRDVHFLMGASAHEISALHVLLDFALDLVRRIPVCEDLA